MMLRSQVDVGLTVTPNKARAFVESKHAAYIVCSCVYVHVVLINSYVMLRHSPNDNIRGTQTKSRTKFQSTFNAGTSIEDCVFGN